MFRKLGFILGVAIAISAAALIPTAASAKSGNGHGHGHWLGHGLGVRRLFRLLHCQARNRYALRASRAAHQGLRLVHGHCQHPGFAKAKSGLRLWAFL
jgi:hypothetical protein